MAECKLIRTVKPAFEHDGRIIAVSRCLKQFVGEEVEIIIRRKEDDN